MLRRAWLGCLLAAVACDTEKNELSGSIADAYSLEFDQLQVIKQGAWLRIEYLNDVGGGQEKVVKLTADLNGLEAEAGLELSGEDFLSRVGVERVAEGAAFPAVTGGSITFDALTFSAGGRVAGEFTVLFGSDTLNGTFDAEIQEVAI